jgi:hypothetical protein
MYISNDNQEKKRALPQNYKEKEKPAKTKKAIERMNSKYQHK